MQCSLSDQSWCQATLLFWLGGLGLRESVFSTSVAFLVSCNGNRDLASTLLSIDANHLFFLMKRLPLLFCLTFMVISPSL